MSQNRRQSADRESKNAGHLTSQQIFHQPELWSTTGPDISAAADRILTRHQLHKRRLLLTGAGSSAYAATAVALAWPRATAVPTTDLLVDTERFLDGVDAVISLARSGESPESAAVVERVRGLRPEILQLAIVCNADSALGRVGLDELLVLDPRTNDRRLVMTSSFSNLVLAGQALAQPAAVAAAVGKHSSRASALLPAIDEATKRVAASVRERIVV